MENLLEFITKPNVLVALILAAVGVMLACIAKRMARAFRHTKDVKDDDVIIVVSKIFGLLMILISLILLIVEF